jgi:hypothetical protein
MPSPFLVHVIGVVPIPVGHEVEVRVFLVDTAIFGKKLEPQFDDPLITHVETGIVYGSASHFKDGAGGGLMEPLADLPLVPRTDRQEHGRWRGRVTATRIAVIEGNKGLYTQTSLSIDPIEGGRPYK